MIIVVTMAESFVRMWSVLTQIKHSRFAQQQVVASRYLKATGSVAFVRTGQIEQENACFGHAVIRSALDA